MDLELSFPQHYDTVTGALNIILSQSGDGMALCRTGQDGRLMEFNGQGTVSRKESLDCKLTLWIMPGWLTERQVSETSPVHYGPVSRPLKVDIVVTDLTQRG